MVLCQCEQELLNVDLTMTICQCGISKCNANVECQNAMPMWNVVCQNAMPMCDSNVGNFFYSRAPFAVPTR